MLHIWRNGGVAKCSYIHVTYIMSHCHSKVPSLIHVINKINLCYFFNIDFFLFIFSKIKGSTALNLLQELSYIVRFIRITVSHKVEVANWQSTKIEGKWVIHGPWHGGKLPRVNYPLRKARVTFWWTDTEYINIVNLHTHLRFFSQSSM